MALNNRSALDPRWAYHNRPVARSFMNCNVSVFHQGLEGQEYNAVTNEWLNSATEIWSGSARIQPLSNSTNVNAISNETKSRRVQMQLDLTGGPMVDIRPGDYIVVEDSPIDSFLESYVYIVREAINSSNPWVRTVVCDVNLEADPNP